MQNIIVTIFEVESEGFQAITELRNNPEKDGSFLSEAALIKKENGTCKVLDFFDTGAHTADDKPKKDMPSPPFPQPYWCDIIC